MKTQQLCWVAAALLACLGCGSSDDDSDSDSNDKDKTEQESDNMTDSENEEETDTGAADSAEEDTGTRIEITVTCGADDCIDPTWISISGGSFEMGSEDGGADETPVHTVTISDFEMMKTEVTLAQYADCVIAGDCTVPDSGNPIEDVWEDLSKGNYPINGVTWSEAVSFCEWIGGRLPSEAEWEFAARSGGQDNRYPWGDGDASCDNTVMIDDANIEGCGTIFVFDVCSKTEGNTESGLCDMAGNVWEWVQDTYQMSYEDAPVDGSAWEEDGTAERVMRGGSYRDDAASQRTTVRSYLFYNASFENLGFRCVR